MIEACYTELANTIKKLLSEKGSIVIAVDGMCGSGKTTLATWLGELYHANVFHIDDYYLPMEQRKEGWELEGGSNIDKSRFCREVLQPAREADGVLYRAYSCQQGKMQEGIRMEKTAVSIVEGSYSHHPDFASYYDLKIFLTCSPEKQEERLIQRAADRYPNYVKRWIPMEMQYFHAFQIQERSDIVIDNSQFF